MMKIGTGELFLILVIAFVIFGPSKLPTLGKMAGKAIGTFKYYINSAENWNLEEAVKADEKNSNMTTTGAAAAVAAPVAPDEEGAEQVTGQEEHTNDG